jgi:filamentous hemagglutinin family protein
MAGRSRLARTRRWLAAGAALWPIAAAQALPPTPNVVAGAASYSTTPAPTPTATVTQTSARAVLEWTSLSLTPGETLNFVQPDRNSVTLNRIVGLNPLDPPPASQIDGTINANGQVWFLNRSGIFMGPDAQINAAGFLATTGAIDTAAFMGGTGPLAISGATAAPIINAGSITVTGGYAVLAGTAVDNVTAISANTPALISANLGSVVLGSGTAFTVDFAGDQLVSFLITSPVTGNAISRITNTGNLIADGGMILMQARAAADIVGSVINTTGLVQARSVSVRGGTITLDPGPLGVNGGMDPFIVLDGPEAILDTSGVGPGGNVNLLGNVIVDANAAILSSKDIIITGMVDSGLPGAANLTVAAPAGTVTFGGDVGALSPLGGLQVAANNLQAQALRLDGPNSLVSLAIGANGTINGAIVSNTLIKNGDGRLLLTDENSALGTLQLEAGLLESPRIFNLGAPNAIDLVGGTLRVADGLAPPLQGNDVFNFFLRATGDSKIELVGNSWLFNSFVTGPGKLSISAENNLLVDANFGLDSPMAGLDILAGGRLTLGVEYGVDSVGDVRLGGVAGVSNLNNFESQITTTSGRWLIWSGNPVPFDANNGDGRGGLNQNPLAFTAYDISLNQFTGLAPLPAELPATNGFLYSLAPTLQVTLAGSATKVYDGTVAAPNASITPSATGAINNDLVTVLVAEAVFDRADVLAERLLFNGVQVAAVDDQNRPVFGYVIAGTENLSNASIDPLPILAQLTGPVERPFDGTTNVTLGPANILVSGLVPGESITVGQASGVFSQANVGTGLLVTTTLLPGDFLAGPGTNLANYILPTDPLSAAIGTITPRALFATLVGSVERSYDGLTAAVLTPQNFALTGLIGTDAFSVSQTAGSFASANAGSGIAVSAALAPTDFQALGGTLAGNYLLPTAATGNIGLITPRLLDATLTGPISRAYDGTTIAALGSGNISLSGLVGADSITVQAATGSYASPNVGNGIAVTASLASATLVAGGATLRSNYQLPLNATGNVGEITPRALAISLTGVASKPYDGGLAAALSTINYQLGGLVAGETIAVTQTAGVYASRNAGTGIGVSASLSPTDFVAGAGTLLSNYQLPTTANGLIGIISPKLLTASLTGSASRIYDGALLIDLGSTNIQLSGLAAGDTITATGATSGTLASPDVGTGIQVAAALTPSDFVAGGGTLLTNYVLPTAASGPIATITPRALTATLVGAVEKIFDGTTAAALTTQNIAFAGLVAGQSLAVSSLSGTYASPNAGTGILVSTTLTNGQFTAGPNTLLANYALPTGTISGAIGTITPRQLVATLVGQSQRTFDGLTNAVLTSQNYALDGLLGTDAFAVSQTAGSFASANAGTNILVTATLGAGDFQALGGTIAGNYLLPSTAAGNIGIITPRLLTVTLTGSIARPYDGTTSAAIGTANVSLSGLVGTDAIAVQAATASFATPNAGTDLLVTADLAAATLVPGGGAILSNYQLPATASGTIGTITPKALILTLTGPVEKIYDGSASARLEPANYQLTGLVGAETLIVNQTVGTYATANAGDGIAVTTNLLADNFTAGPGTLLANYQLPTGSLSGAVGTITPRPLAVSIIGTVAKVYDGTVSASIGQANLSLSGLVPGQTIVLTPSAASYAQANVGTGILVSMPVSPGSAFAIPGTLLSNYQLPGLATGLVGNITPRPLQASLVGQTSRLYDGTTVIALADANIALTGLVAGDVITASTAVGTLASANVGTGLLVSAQLTPGNFTTAGGTAATNYSFPELATGLIGTVLPRPLTASLVGTAEKIFDGNTQAALASPNFTLSGLVAGEAITVSQTVGTYASANAGNNILVTAAIGPDQFAAGPGTMLGNYTLPGAAQGLIGFISPRPLSVSLVGAVSRPYDGTTLASLAADNFLIAGGVAGQTFSITATQGQFATANAATGLLVSAPLAAADFVAGPGTLASNYLLPSSASGQIGTISPRPLSATLIGSIQRIYDGTTAASLAPTNFALSGLVSGENLVVTATAGTFATPNVGTGLSVSALLAATDFAATPGTVLANYALPTAASGAIGTITPRSLLATLVGTAARPYDGTDSAALTSGNFALDGLVAGEGLVITPPVGRYATRDAGTGIIVTADLARTAFLAQPGTSLDNYVLPVSASGAIGIISPRALSITLTGSSSRIYDGTSAAPLAAANFLVSGLVANEQIAVGVTTGSYQSPNVGTNIVVNASLNPGSFSAGPGTRLANYLLPTSATGAIGQITPRPLLVTLTGDVRRVYDGSTTATVQPANIAVSGLVTGETISVTPGTGSFASPNVGNAIRVSVNLPTTSYAAGGNTLLGNYELPATASGLVGSITPATLTYVADSARRLAGAPNPLFTGSVSGFVAGDTLANATSGVLLFASPATAQSPPGTYAILGSGLTARNYLFQQAPGNEEALTITSNVINEIIGTINNVTNLAGTAGTTPPAPAGGANAMPGQPGLAQMAPAGLTAGITPTPNATGGSPFLLAGAPAPAATPVVPLAANVLVLPAGPIEPSPPSPIAGQPDLVPPDPDDADDSILEMAIAPPVQRKPAGAGSAPAPKAVAVTAEIAIENEEAASADAERQDLRFSITSSTPM